jgi:hypothetical protein
MANLIEISGTASLLAFRLRERCNVGRPWPTRHTGWRMDGLPIMESRAVWRQKKSDEGKVME